MSGTVLERKTHKNRIIPFIREFIIENQMTPTVDELADGLGASKSTIHQHLKNLDTEGKLRYKGRIGIPKDMIKEFV